MGFFDKLFGGKGAAETKFKGEKKTVMMPLAGKVIPLEELPDETFASAILGGGCGIEPTGDTVYAPFDGTVTQVPEAVAFRKPSRWREAMKPAMNGSQKLASLPMPRMLAARLSGPVA